MLSFRIGRPQLYAGALLLVFLVQSLWLVQQMPANPHDYSAVQCGRALWGISDQATCEYADSALTSRAVAAPLLFVRHIEGIQTRQLSEWDLFRFAPWTRTLFRMPFVLFGLWLGGGLWWVARRLFGTGGGVVALALYCTSPYIVIAASTIAPSIIVAWGFFGAIYTAIGIGHTILAPIGEWKFRVLLLGTALGCTFAAAPGAALVALIFSALFLLYLAPERRPQAAGVLLMSCLMATVIAALFCGTRLQLLTTAGPVLSWRWLLRFFGDSGNVPLYAMFAVAFATFLGWKRARYFGSWSPLLVAALVPFLTVRWIGAEPLVWSLPFLFVFVGGVFADLFESSLKVPAAITAALLIIANAWTGWHQLGRTLAMARSIGGTN